MYSNMHYFFVFVNRVIEWFEGGKQILSCTTRGQLNPPLSEVCGSGFSSIRDAVRHNLEKPDKIIACSAG